MRQESSGIRLLVLKETGKSRVIGSTLLNSMERSVIILRRYQEQAPDQSGTSI